MSFKDDYKKIGKIDWYYQGAASRPLYTSYPVLACNLFKIFGKKIPVKFRLAILMKDNFQENYLSKASLKKVALYYHNKQKADHNFIKKLMSFWHLNRIKPYLELNREILKTDLTELSDGDLLKLFNKFNELYMAVWHEAIFLDGYDYYGGKILEDAIKRQRSKIAGDDLNLILTPPALSFTQQERLSVLVVAEKILRNKKALGIVRSKNYHQAVIILTWLKKDLEKISHHYYWLHNDYASVEYLSPAYFYKNLRSLLKNKEKIKEEREIKLLMENLGHQKRAVYKKYKLSAEFINLVNYLSLLGNFRDERKSYNQMAGNALRKIALEIADRTGNEINLIEHLYHWEIPKIFKDDGSLIRLAKLRMNLGVIHLYDIKEKRGIFYGQTAVKINKFIKKSISSESELKGMVACSGLVKGIVKIIKDKNDFFKLKKGEILVSQNTRPEFVPIMKIAAAIITDEGGITSHAAIVSRELKIPGIVGVQGATMKLKDGDLVEVDANNGIVRIINKIMTKNNKNKGEIIIYKTKQGPKLDVKMEKRTVWLTQAQVGLLFNIERSVITKHIKNIFDSGELKEKSNVQNLHITGSDKPVKFYNLDVVLSVGYRVNSKRATQFRIWATRILKDHLVQGYTINEKRLLEVKEKFVELQNVISFLSEKSRHELLAGQEQEILNLLAYYSNSLAILEKYDKNKLVLPAGGRTKYKMTYELAQEVIKDIKAELVKKKQASDIFGRQSAHKLESILANLWQTFGGRELYRSLEEKAAHLLYLIIKDHPFIDGNKRIASFLFVYFLDKNNFLYRRNGEKKINDNALVALALLTATSDPKDKEVIIKIVGNLLK